MSCLDGHCHLRLQRTVSPCHRGQRLSRRRGQHLPRRKGQHLSRRRGQHLPHRRGQCPLQGTASQGTVSLPPQWTVSPMSQGTASLPPQWTVSPTSQGTVPPPPPYLPSLQRLLQNSILPELSLMLCMMASGKTVPSICAGAMQASSASCLWPCCLAGSMGNSPPGHTLMLRDHRPDERRQLCQCLRGGGGAEGWKTKGDVALMAMGGLSSDTIPARTSDPWTLPPGGLEEIKSQSWAVSFDLRRLKIMPGFWHVSSFI